MTTRPSRRPPPRPAGEPILEVEDIHSFYGAIEALKGISLEVYRGRDRHADRLQRRRQDDDAALDLRDPAAAQGKIVFEGREIQEMPATRSRRSGSPSRRRGGASSRA